MGSLEKTEGGITFPQGFRAAGVEAHVKYPNRKDFALLVSDVPAACAGIFTTNAIAAAPVRLDRELATSSRQLSAIAPKRLSCQPGKALGMRAGDMIEVEAEEV